MSHNSSYGPCEEKLDRDLAQLIPSVADGPTHHVVTPSPSNSPSDSLAPVPGRMLTVEDFRAEVSGSIREGMVLSENIYDVSGVLLLGAGSLLTERFLQLLLDRHIQSILLGSATEEPDPLGDALAAEAPSAEDFQTAPSRELDRCAASALLHPITYRPLKAWRRPRLSIEDLKDEAARGVEKHAATSAAVTDICESLSTGRRVSSAALRESVHDFVEMSAVDFDLLPLIVATRHSQDEYLYDHCVNVSLLAMAIGCQLGLDRESITAIGLGGLLQDIGMLRVPLDIRLAPRELTEREWHEIRRHPLHTLDMLSNVREIPQVVRFVSYHAHERIDGSGYPHRRAGEQLHKFAQIVAIADVYAAMTHPRPYHDAMHPYEAARRILVEQGGHTFDAILLRAFLDTVSMFPIGSCVGLSSGLQARVLRANPGLHTRPIVEELTPEGFPTGNIIDLAEDHTLQVVTAA